RRRAALRSLALPMDRVTRLSVVAAPAHAPVRYLPADARLEMPAQSLRESGRAPRRLATAPPNILVRRAFVFGAAGALTLFGAWQMYLVLAVGGLTALEAVILALFVILFAWIGLSFASTLGGLIAMMTGGASGLDIDPDAPLPEISTRTALLLP